jgi:hypothetical protein
MSRTRARSSIALTRTRRFGECDAPLATGTVAGRGVFRAGPENGGGGGRTRRRDRAWGSCTFGCLSINQGVLERTQSFFFLVFLSSPVSDGTAADRQADRRAGNGSKERVMARRERQERDKQTTKMARDKGQRQCRSSRQAKALGILAGKGSTAQAGRAGRVCVYVLVQTSRIIIFATCCIVTLMLLAPHPISARREKDAGRKEEQRRRRCGDRFGLVCFVNHHHGSICFPVGAAGGGGEKRRFQRRQTRGIESFCLCMCFNAGPVDP